jgi:aminoglycoside phosphotransferase (APT) family kinase protein
VQTPPADVSETAVLEAVRDGWDAGATSAAYLPVGYGSHHWAVAGGTGRRWFVTADATPSQEQAARLQAAYGVPAAARAAGVSGAHGPVPSRDGALLWPLGRWSISAQPWLDGVAGAFGDRWPTAGAEQVVRLLAGLHALPPDAVPAQPEDLALPGRADLEDALDRCARGERLAGGPVAAAVADLLTRYGAVARAALAEHDLAPPPAPSAAVLTHGEPHPGNVVVTRSGPVLVDWDTARLAEPERDLWLVAARTDLDVPALYRELAGRDLDRARMRWRERRWALADVAVYVPELVGAPREDADTTWQLRALRGTLDDLAGP